MKPSILTLPLGALALSTASVLAGSDAKTAIEEPPAKNGDWCSWLQDDPGTLYKDKNNPYIQEVAIVGRFHWQYGYVDGEAAGQDFNYDTEEIRRFRLGAKVKFLNYFTFSGSVDLEDDTAPTGQESDHDIEYADIYSATLSFNARKAFDIESLDGLKISIGKHKSISNGEQAVSSKHIKTIERSGISNYTHPGTATGLVISLDKGAWDFDLGVYSGDLEPEFSEFDNSNDYFYALRVGRSLGESALFEKSRLDLRVLINGDEAANSGNNPVSPGVFDLDWVGSLAFKAEQGRFNLLTDIIYGDNGSATNSRGRPRPDRAGTFWGVVILPSYWICEDRLEAVFRYQYAHASENQGIRINSRYVRRAGSVGSLPAVAEGRGDEHHSAYLGLNYHLCTKNAKVMVGVEYDDLSSGGVDVYEGFSAWAAFRLYF